MKAMIPALVIGFFLVSMNVQQDIPSQIQTFIQKHYSGRSVVKYKSEIKPHKTEYKVHLDKDVKIEFDKGFNPVEIEDDFGLPASVIPASIQSYLKQKYPDIKVVEWKKKANKQEVELQNGLELEFDLKGTFLRIDR